MSGIAEKVYDTIKKKPGIDTNALMSFLSMTRSKTHNAIQFLRKKNLVIGVRDGRECQWHDKATYYNVVDKKIIETMEKVVMSKAEKPVAPKPAPVVVKPALRTSLQEQITALAATMAGEIVSEVERQLVPLLSELLKPVPQQAVAEVKEVVLPPREAVAIAAPVEPVELRSLLVIGLLGHLNHQLEEEFSSCFDITCMSNEENIHTMMAKAKHMDHVIVAVNFIGHKHIRALNSVGIKPVLVNGGISTIRDTITKLFVDDAAQ